MTKKIGRKNLFIGAFAVMFAALLWSLDGVFIRPKLYHIDASILVFLEHFLGFILLSPFIFLNWKKIKFLSLKDWGAVFWVSLFGGLIGTIMITKAFFAAINGEATFATIIILQKIQPVFALLMARLILGEKFKLKFYFWASLAIISGYFLSFGKEGINFYELSLNLPAIFALLAAFSFGSSTVFGKKLINHIDFKAATALRFGVTAILGFIFLVLTGKLFLVSSLEPVHWKLLALIVFSSGAAALFIYYYGLKKISASAATICELFWPFSAVILDYVINKNFLSPMQFVASAILLLSFYGVISSKIKNQKFQAKIIKGEGRGKIIGSPTLNLDKVDLNIAHGVYLVEAIIDNKKYKGVLHFGFKETFLKEQSLELYIKPKINVKKKIILVKIIKKTRKIKKFKDKNELKAQIKKDIKVLFD
jgi:drug/metabolite transporter (DMT)-like permease